MKNFLLSLFLICCASVFIAVPELFSQTERGMKPIAVRTHTGKAINLYEASHALIVGNGNYTHWKPLPGALRDVKEVKLALETHGFNVTLKTDLHKADFDRAVAEFVLEAGRAKANRLLFYYAGHGYTRKSATNEDLGYLVMVDAPQPTQDAVGFELASTDMKTLVTQAEKIQARHVLFLFDSCFSGTILNVRDEKKPPESISDSIKYPVRQFITAGRAGEVVPDHSNFKQVFLDLIQGRAREPFPDGYITGEELGYYLKNQVPVYNKAQHPQYGKIRDPRLDKGDFVFVLSKNGGNDGIELDPIAVLNITSSPSGASVYVDGILVGKTPLRRYQIDTGARLEKQVNIGVELSGYRSRVQKVILKGEDQFPWDIRLEKIPIQPIAKPGNQSLFALFVRAHWEHLGQRGTDLEFFVKSIENPDNNDWLKRLVYAQRVISCAIARRTDLTQPSQQLLEMFLRIMGKRGFILFLKSIVEDGRRLEAKVDDLERQLEFIESSTDPGAQVRSAIRLIEVANARGIGIIQPYFLESFFHSMFQSMGEREFISFLKSIVENGKRIGAKVDDLERQLEFIESSTDPEAQVRSAIRLIEVANARKILYRERTDADGRKRRISWELNNLP